MEVRTKRRLKIHQRFPLKPVATASVAPVRVLGAVAIEIAEMLSSMLLTRTLKRYAVYFDLETGASQSVFCTEQEPTGHNFSDKY